MGAWIEIQIDTFLFTGGGIASYMGAWIEMDEEVEDQAYYDDRILYGCVD